MAPAQCPDFGAMPDSCLLSSGSCSKCRGLIFHIAIMWNSVGYIIIDKSAEDQDTSS